MPKIRWLKSRRAASSIAASGENFIGFFAPDVSGQWSGFDVDYCRAVASAVFGDKNKVKFLAATPSARFTQLQSGQVDMLSRSVTDTFSRDNSLGVDFPFFSFYDGHALMVAKSLGVKTVKDLEGASVCTQTGLSTEVIVADFFKSQGMTYKPVVFELPRPGALGVRGRPLRRVLFRPVDIVCLQDALRKPDDYIILDYTISKSLNGPVVRHGDNNWGDIVRWTGYVLVAAEEFGVTSENVDVKKADPSAPAEVRRMLGVEGGFGDMLGLPNDWAYNIIKLMGNYGEVYERNIGGEWQGPHSAREDAERALDDWRRDIAPSFQ